MLDSLEESHSFVLTTHREPDGDGLGAEAALAEVLEQLGKVVRVVNNDEVPKRYVFLELASSFEIYDPAIHNHLVAHSDALVVLDAAHPNRTGRMEEELSSFSGTTIVIDHHPTGGWAEVDYIDSSAAATCELVDEIVSGLNVTLTPTIAEALYTGIASDTQCFMTPNTTADTHRRASRMLDSGASLEKVHQALWGSWTVGRLKLQGHFLQNIEFAAGGRLVYGVVTQAALRRWDQTPADLEGLVNQALTIEGSQMAILVHVGDDEKVRLSFRSRNGVEVNRLAQSLGGGGHKRAAGATVEGEQNTVLPMVLNRAEGFLR